MQTHHKTALFTFLTLPALGCPDINITLDDTSSGEEIGTETTTDSGTDSTGDGDTTDETTETGAPDLPAPEMVWNVYDANNDFVGRLVSPAPELFVDHDDMFSQPEPRVANLVDPDNFGFLLNFSGPSFIPVAHDVVRYTGPNCTGTTVDYFASPAGMSDVSLPAAMCDTTWVEQNPDSVFLHYGLHDVFADYVHTYWPGAEGLVVARNLAFEWYHLPTDQPWPSHQTAVSKRPTNGGACEAIADEFVCAVELTETDWMPAMGGGPFRLVEEPAP